MTRRFPFALKLGISFLIVILIAVALVYFLTARGITSHFAAYREQNKEQVAKQVCGLLAEYRMRTGTWLGVEQLLTPAQYTMLINGRLIVQRTSLIGGDFSLANENGTIVVSTQEAKVGTKLTETQIDSGIPIMGGEQQLGTLVVDTKGTSLNPDEEIFLSAAKRSALVGGGIASGLALLLATLLIPQVLSPLRLLSRATDRIAQGDLSQRVNVRARDEFGRLGESFNRMVDGLSRSEKLRRTMTADIAHELRTPVTIVQGNLEAILDGIYTPDNETIVPIYEQTLHLGRLIDDLQELALAEAGELRMEGEPTDLAKLVNQVIETVESSLDEGPTISVSTEEDLPEITVDPLRIRQVLANLLGNALRYTPEEGRVHVDVARRDDWLEVQVTDSGPGITPEDLPHLFERFYRGDWARARKTGGSGLGLAIAKQWVEAHGGTIWAENAESGGARFTFRLPLA
jgi:signal transduction histidine kinase